MPARIEIAEFFRLARPLREQYRAVRAITRISVNFCHKRLGGGAFGERFGTLIRGCVPLFERDKIVLYSLFFQRFR